MNNNNLTKAIQFKPTIDQNKAPEKQKQIIGILLFCILGISRLEYLEIISKTKLRNNEKRRDS